jgi:hypothetical protein
VIGSPIEFQTPLLVNTWNPFFRQFIPLLFLYFFVTFFSIDIGTDPRETRPLYNDIKRRAQGNFFLLTISSIFVLPWLTFAFCIIVPFLLR